MSWSRTRWRAFSRSCSELSVWCQTLTRVPIESNFYNTFPLNRTGPFLFWFNFEEIQVVTKNPAYRRHQLSRPKRIVGPIQFWRGCVIYRSAPKSGLGPRENADSVHAKVGTRSTQKCWLGLLRNTSPFLGLFSRLWSRSRPNSGTHPCFYGSTRDQDWTPEHILVFKALLEIEIEIELWNTSLFLGLYLRSSLRLRLHQSTEKARSAPVRPRKKIAWEGDKHTDNTKTDFATTRPTRPRGPTWWKVIFCVVHADQTKIPLKFTKLIKTYS